VYGRVCPAAKVRTFSKTSKLLAEIFRPDEISRIQTISMKSASRSQDLKFEHQEIGLTGWIHPASDDFNEIVFQILTVRIPVKINSGTYFHIWEIMCIFAVNPI
jgi:hypothetical protein